ncbi:hypothetical protein Taro_015969, partial [Colocasia esculenta]|nr:hypothetical protein [Colocasia esculenta]
MSLPDFDRVTLQEERSMQGSPLAHGPERERGGNDMVVDGGKNAGCWKDRARLNKAQEKGCFVCVYVCV